MITIGQRLVNTCQYNWHSLVSKTYKYFVFRYRHLVKVSFLLRWEKGAGRAAHGINGIWGRGRFAHVFQMWPGLLGCLLCHRNQLQPRGAVLHGPREGRWVGSVCSFLCKFIESLLILYHLPWDVTHSPLILSPQPIFWMLRLWVVWRQKSATWRLQWSSSITKPSLSWPDTAVTHPSATRLTRFQSMVFCTWLWLSSLPGHLIEASIRSS